MQQTSCWYRDGFPKQAASLHLSFENLQRFLKKIFILFPLPMCTTLHLSKIAFSHFITSYVFCLPAACHQVRPTQPQDILNKEKQVHNPLIISQTTTYNEIRFVQSLDSLDKRRQVCSPLPIFETGCTSGASTQHFPTLNIVPSKGLR